MLFGEGGRFNEAATAIRTEQAGLIAHLLRELPGREREPTREQLDAIAHIFVGAAEAIAFWAVDRPDVPAARGADHLMTVLWPFVRELLPLGRAFGFRISASAGGSCQEMEPAVDFAGEGSHLSDALRNEQSRRPAAPFPATRPRGVYGSGFSAVCAGP